jgi:hypothetical protein
MLAEAMAGTQDDWWIIGSVAVALHGGDPGVIADVDVILSRRDLDALYTHLPLVDEREEGKAEFLSQRFGRWRDPPLSVEFMADFSMLEGGEWRAVLPQTRARFDLEAGAVFTPERAELIALLHRFGREKDLARAASIAG